MIGKALEPVLAPVGFNWQIAVALIPAWPRAKSRSRRSAPSMRSRAARKRPSRSARCSATKWSLATALSLLAWYIFAPQCASTLAVIRRETGGWRFMWITFFYMLALAYAAAF